MSYISILISSIPQTEKTVGGGEEKEIAGSFTLTLTLRQDVMGQLKKDNETFLEEEKERLMGDAEQEIAEVIGMGF